jgi:hypothetical protein
MPRLDGTGPWWAQGRSWRCWRAYGRGAGWRWRNIPILEPTTLTKDQQKTFLEEELKEIELEQQEIKKRLAELAGENK